MGTFPVKKLIENGFHDLHDLYDPDCNFGSREWAGKIAVPGCLVFLHWPE
jgi:hypothetical protein